MTSRVLRGKAAGLFVLALLALIARPGRANAQGRGGGQAPAALTPQAAAPKDLTGYWVSVITEDWRWRMTVPDKGDVASIPLNPEGRESSQHLGSDEGPGGGRAMQVVRRCRSPARAWTSAYYLGQRQHAADRYRFRDTDSFIALWWRTADGRHTRLAGVLGGFLGRNSGRTRRAGPETWRRP